jgi:excisionase family DNA binding protein
MPRKKEYPDILSLAEFQKYIRVGYYKATDLLITGQVPAQKLGTRWRIHKSAADAWLMAGQKGDPQC